MWAAILKFFVLHLLVTATACQFCDNSSKSDSGIDTLLRRKIVFPESLLLIRSGEIYQLDSFHIKGEGQLKIVSIVDANCVSCINQIELFDKKIFSIIPKDKVLIVFIMNIKPEEYSYFIANLYPYIKSDGYILWDKDYNFERINDLFTTQLNLRTFMLNKEDEIVLVGNPLIKPDLINDYGDYFRHFHNSGQ